ncbi:MAG: bifunctional 3-deoxy-7-phosphoheptulonate synthase/chorismate mutase type II [Bacteroidales bacterium]|nr:bifunctional 3-deoxy-7-phosphoheptulonate synthase/chorismate mutase type II [Bacteroidales bacterium]
MELKSILLPGIDPKRPLVISGPCSAESEEQVMSTAKSLSKLGVKIFRAGVWKPRTKPGGFEGHGAKAFPWLKRVKEELKMYIAVEVANVKHVRKALANDVDIIWIGARTSANPFSVQEIADALEGTDIPVLIKNPINPDVDLWIGAIQRIYKADIRRIGAIHRGFSSADKKVYRNLPQWHIPIELHRQIPNLPIICDPSHIGGRRELIAPICQQAMDLNFDGLIIETHCNPDKAWSDAAQQITPEALELILDNIVIRETTQSTESLTALRRQIDGLDNDLLALLAKRMRVSQEIGTYKKEHNMPILQAQRYDKILKNRVAQAEKMGMSGEFMKTVLMAIHEESVRQQMLIMK